MTDGGEIVLYNTEDGREQIRLRLVGGTVWLTQAEIADLFATTIQNVSLHLKNIFISGELSPDSVIKESLITAADGKSYSTSLYNLAAILAVGFRVRSPRGIQFRRWASTVLQEYLVKGFVIEDDRLKQPDYDYFDELLERIRDIRASEARFYQKVRDILALSEDYQASSQAALEFYAKIQNKMLYATTGHTAAELIVARANDVMPNMALNSWKGSRVRKSDVTTAKNYLANAEISELNLIVTMFLDTADLRARRRETMRLREWDVILDRFLAANELPILRHNGSISAKYAEAVAHDRYARFDKSRKEAVRRAAEDASDIDASAELEAVEKAAIARRKSRRPL